MLSVFGVLSVNFGAECVLGAVSWVLIDHYALSVPCVAECVLGAECTLGAECILGC